MSFLLDTCVVSDAAKARPPQPLVKWTRAVDWSRCFLSSLTLGEIGFGAVRLDDGARRRRIEGWLDGELRLQFGTRILPVDGDVAERWGQFRVDLLARRLTTPIVDSLIAATALHHRLTVVTRNRGDFASFGVAVFDPWSES